MDIKTTQTNVHRNYILQSNTTEVMLIMAGLNPIIPLALRISKSRQNEFWGIKFKMMTLLSQGWVLVSILMIIWRSSRFRSEGDLEHQDSMGNTTVIKKVIFK
jgi:hypothetical protein